MTGTDAASRTVQRQRHLRVGLLNNAPERAAKAIERRFQALLAALPTDMAIGLDIFAPHRHLAGVHQAAGHQAARHQAAEAIFDSDLDALIVTGMEPQTARLQDEPIWPLLARVIDWSVDRELPVAWSCLAAHAAVLHLDGITRQPLPVKLSGLYEAKLVDHGHRLAGGLPARWLVPHSRWNDLPEHRLLAAGYRPLSRIEAGADIFARIGLPFLFLQGHPEYDSRSLLLEYRRDVRRFFAAEKAEYPPLPTRCVEADLGEKLARLAETAVLSRRAPSVLGEILDLLDQHPPADHAWRGVAERLFLNWLTPSVIAGDAAGCVQSGVLRAVAFCAHSAVAVAR